jgi:hypothetical protein
MNDIALIVLHVQIDQDLGIGPGEFRHNSLDRYRILLVTRGIPVGCEHHAGEDQKSSSRGAFYNFHQVSRLISRLAAYFRMRLGNHRHMVIAGPPKFG